MSARGSERFGRMTSKTTPSVSITIARPRSLSSGPFSFDRVRMRHAANTMKNGRPNAPIAERLDEDLREDASERAAEVREPSAGLGGVRGHVRDEADRDVDRDDDDRPAEEEAPDLVGRHPGRRDSDRAAHAPPAPTPV